MTEHRPGPSPPKAAAIALDFGTSNTVLAAWDANRQQGVPLHLTGYSRALPAPDSARSDESVSVIPSVIHYATSNLVLIGQQVYDRGLESSPQTFRWMKRYIARRSPTRIRVANREIDHAQAAHSFLHAVLRAAAAATHATELGLSVPVESFEDYEHWLLGVTEGAGIRHFRLIDEPAAAALGYGIAAEPGDIYMVFDFGGGTLDVAIMLIEATAAAATGRRCRTLGKAGTDLGGVTIDGWLYEEVLRQSGYTESDDVIRLHSRALLAECERAKEALSFQGAVEWQSPAPTGQDLRARLDRQLLEDLFRQHDGFSRIEQTVRKAVRAAADRGFAEDQIKAVLMVGGTSRIPAVQQLLERTFGRTRVHHGRPLGAVARGAAAFAAGVQFYDHIQHHYSVRHVDPATGAYEYRTIVPQGTPYPTQSPASRMTIKASFDGQEEMGIAIFELSDVQSVPSRGEVELLFDPSGAARLRPIRAEQAEQASRLWVNEAKPMFLARQPPAKKGEACYEVEFAIDVHKRLLLTARDLRTGHVLYRAIPVIQLR